LTDAEPLQENGPKISTGKAFVILQHVSENCFAVLNAKSRGGASSAG
jgi:hypothetical protein